MSLKKMPVGIQNFEEIITEGYLYVDKTQYVHELITEGKYYFLSRPRRFGKSLMLDTIGAAFSGNKELFKGLFIYDSDYSFEKHPVLRFDMGNISNGEPQILKESLIYALKLRAEDEGFNLMGTLPSDLFKHLISLLHKKYNKKVVILIDEYDKPILDRLGNIDIAEANREVIGGFYGVLKSMDAHIRFTFITGVTKFTKTSIFSGLNNLLDITMHRKYVNICGIAIEDFEKYFGEHIEKLKALDNFTQHDDIKRKILAWYDGYSWDGKNRVINPFSLLCFFTEGVFRAYWYSSGTPTFLIEMLKERPASFLSLRNLVIGEWSMDSFDIRRMEPESLLFQTGYLTVKEIPPHDGTPSYLLEIPNFEVREAFNLHILAGFTESGEAFTESSYRKMKELLKSGDLQNVLEILKGLFASIPYQLHVDAEAYYHSIFYAIMTLLGFDISAEVSTAKGRADAVLELDGKIYIIEFKYINTEQDIPEDKKQKLFDEALSSGMKQIRDKGYSEKYAGSGKTLYHAAFAFLGRDNIKMICEKE
ncbi:MAG: ATP-binding protein [Oscillospiraceae bacterium]|nr:ATP-binding protein [Oscillospiraceae bacterium]